MCCEKLQLGDIANREQYTHWCKTHPGRIYAHSGNRITDVTDIVHRDDQGRPMSDGDYMRREMEQEQKQIKTGQ